MNEIVSSQAFIVEHPGMLSLIQDLGRFGYSHIGLTQGGPADAYAFFWANQLLDNDPNASQIEVAIGGLKLKVNIPTKICVTGANGNLLINGQSKPRWATHSVNPGDTIELGFAQQGVKSYLAVKGGFQVRQQFGSAATVAREGVGGLDNERGCSGLVKNDKLAAASFTLERTSKYLLAQDIQTYPQQLRLRVILGYQQKWFSRTQQSLFFASEYKVSKQWDRMGYRLEGPAINCQQQKLLSEGICLGAIQIPPDGQPIILMHDRQTIGGYPKIGSVFSLDVSRLAQCGQGASIYFEPITMEQAHNELHLAQFRLNQIKPAIRAEVN